MTNRNSDSQYFKNDEDDFFNERKNLFELNYYYKSFNLFGKFVMFSYNLCFYP